MSALFEPLSGLVLLDPWLLLLGLLIPLALVFRRWRGVPAVRFAAARFLAGEGRGAAPTILAGGGSPVSWRVRLVNLPRILQVLGLVLVVLALARPARLVRLPHANEGIDILLCLDVSSSMAAQDMDQERTRLDVARDAAVRFVAGRPEDRIGLVTFARYPDLRSPLTLDHTALAEVLRRVELVEGDGPEDATGIGTAVARAAQALAHGGEAAAGSAGSRSRVVIVLTDGEENVATAETPDEIAPLHAAQLCKDRDVRVYTIAAGRGVGDAASGAAGPDTRQIRNLARKTGGRFFEARDSEAIANVYDHISALEKTEIAEPRYEAEERFLPFLLAALTLLFAGRLLAGTVLEVLP